jgi:RNA polymerase sigma factor (sigma-70 family)
MTIHDSELLKAYAADGSEPAFNELVRRHLGLVHSAALRLLDGNAAEAEDVAQTVFTDLARKARDLGNHGSLAGWLHTSTRFAAGKLRRTEQRRRHREHATMHLPTPDDSGAVWEDIQPCLDDALHELPETDREAVLLRFFEKLSLTEVGSRLGVGEDAARKRVDRALDKLRGLLAARGVTSATTAGLVAAFTAHLTAEASAALQQQIAGTALQQATMGAAVGTVAGGGLLAWFFGWPAKVALVTGIAAIVASVAVQRLHPGDHGGVASSVPATNSTEQAKTTPVAIAAAAQVAGAVAPTVEEDTAGQLKLLLYLVDAATDKPVTSGEIEFRGWEGSKFIGKTYRSDTNGYARVYYPIGITGLEVTTRIDGLADTRLKWTPKNGEIIPPDYTLKLVQGTTIGGLVVDGQGRPIPDSTVTVRPEPDPNNLTRPKSHEFGRLQVRTGSDGRWSVSRVAPASVGKLVIQAAQRGFLSTQQMVFRVDQTRSDAEMVASLMAGTHRLELKAGRTIRGFVKNAEGRAVAGALVTINGFYVGAILVETESAADGGFTLVGCHEGELSIGAHLEGVGTALQTVTADQDEATLVLGPMPSLRIRVLSHDGKPVEKAEARLGRETFRNWIKHRNFTEQPTEPFSPRILRLIDSLERTQPEPGVFVWNDVPAFLLPVAISAPGYLEQQWIGFDPKHGEHTVQLHPSLRVRGEVRDALTGRLIPEFEMTVGRALIREGLPTVPMFPAEEAYTTAHVGGRFERMLDDLFGAFGEKDGYMIRFSAPGYAPLISRRIEADEGDIVLPVTLTPAGIRLLTLVLPDGNPAANVEVAPIDLAGAKVVVGRDGFDPGQNRLPFKRTDARGRVGVLKTDSVIGYAAASPLGFVELDAANLPDEATVTLQPWGRIEGLLVEDGRPLAGRTVVLRSPKVPMLSEVGLQLSERLHSAQTDGEGRFVMPQVPPGPWNLLERVSGGSGVPELIQIPPGETLQVVIGDSGALVSANVGVPGGMVEGLTITGRMDAENAIPPNGTSVVDWMRDPAHQAAFAGAWQIQGRFSDGRLLIRNVPPGNYRLRIHAQRDDGPHNGPAGLKLPAEISAEVREQILKSFHKKDVFQIDRPVTVPDPVSAKGIHLGEIRLEPVAP